MKRFSFIFGLAFSLATSISSAYAVDCLKDHVGCLERGMQSEDRCSSITNPGFGSFDGDIDRHNQCVRDVHTNNLNIVTACLQKYDLCKTQQTP